MLQQLINLLRYLFGLERSTIFVFHDGVRTRRIDPFEVLRRIFGIKDFDWDETPALIKTGLMAVQLDSFKSIANAVRTAFELPSVEKGGLTEIECLQLLTDFREYLGDVKKNGSLFPILPDSQESEPKTQSETEDFPTKPGWDFGSMPPELSAAQRGSPAEPTTGT